MARIAGILIALIAALGPAAPTSAGTAAEERAAALCERAILVGARRGGVPADVLRAVALTETGRTIGGRLRPWPWAINREGEGHWFADRDEALAFAEASLAAGRRSFDVSCFQINYNWHGHAFPSLEAMFDPEVAGTYAAQFLRSLHAELGDWSAAAGAYHSRTPALAARYRGRFDRIYAGLAGQPLVVAEVDAEAPAAEAGAEAGQDAAPKRSRTRMAVKPKIVHLAAAAARDDPRAARVAAIRVERGRTPRSVRSAVAAGRPVAVSTRDAPL
jgi:hypothetical protein